MRAIIKKTGGFTIVELLVSVFVVSLLTLAMITMNEMTSRQQKRESFQNDVEKVLTYFRAARSDAISNRQMGSVVTDGGFGINIYYYTDPDGSRKMKLTRYVDNQNDAMTGEPDNILTLSGGNPVDHVIDETLISVPWDFTLENPYPPGVSTGGTLNTLFVPPNSDMIINNGTAAGDMRSVDIVFEFDNQKKRICMNRVSRFFEILTGEICS